MPWNLIISFVVGFLNRWLATKRAEQALRDLGASTQRADSLREADRQEHAARQAGAAAADAADDPRDLRD
ncbi:peptidoglycan-binding protein [Methylobacterium dankookense]|uniref:Uncharacterized protein n=1 Tax=Methylobacterium dankookense TaxID=560405 RepID=A0A564G7W3_9HYPH|nr:peptidoglycan-binding protein [Methylobacterium dankookense]GJD59294.1 hypothetical protein IFDJLNFL_5222 [Methylobacterium dankookense]VUF16018.1 hypothetical protein MTDSW087_05767 [Methylobacterium dankookense]